MDAKLFYDNLVATPFLSEPRFVEVERVYALDFNRFSDADVSALVALYRALPGGYREADIARWFGNSESSPPFLWASAEPSGLQVAGVLPEPDWLNWHRAFLVGFTEYPFPRHDFG